MLTAIQILFSPATILPRLERITGTPVAYFDELSNYGAGRTRERVRGIEPPHHAWEACVLPLYYTRTFYYYLSSCELLYFLFSAVGDESRTNGPARL